MANLEHIELLKQGVGVWNRWREENPEIEPDLNGANLNGAYLTQANLSETDLNGACLISANLMQTNLSKANLIRSILLQANLMQTNLSGTNLSEAYLGEAKLIGADLSGAKLIGADLSGAKLIGAKFICKAKLINANLSGADLSGAKFIGADLSGANLSRTLLVGTYFTDAILTNCTIYGIAAWNIHLENAEQKNLVITQSHEATITVDNLKIAQFIYLLLDNQEIHQVIDTITSKVVLILGRFTPERKAVLDALRDQLRHYNYSPVVFDFEKPSSRDFTETVRTLAHMSKFILADLTDPSSIPQELQAIVPDLAVPVQPLLEESKKEYAVFVDFHKYHWVLPTYIYKDRATLLASLKAEIIDQAEEKVEEIVLENASRKKRI